MIFIYSVSETGHLKRTPFDEEHPFLLRQAIWIDCLSITPEEEKFVEAALSLELPTREEMREIEISSRLYKENDILYMTANIISNTASLTPKSEAISFVIVESRLITLRYTSPSPFDVFADRALHSPHFTTGSKVFFGLLDTIVDRLADILEAVSDRGEALSLNLFSEYQTKRNNIQAVNLQEILCEIGLSDDLVAKVHQSLSSIDRMVKFFRHNQHYTPELRESSDTIVGDITSLTEYAAFLSNKISFQLNATLGRITGEQNDIIKIFSVVAVIFVPPTLIASIYGMNFHFMPELSWKYGYLWAFMLMIASAIIPYIYFKKRKWL